MSSGFMILPELSFMSVATALGTQICSRLFELVPLQLSIQEIKYLYYCSSLFLQRFVISVVELENGNRKEGWPAAVLTHPNVCPRVVSAELLGP